MVNRPKTWIKDELAVFLSVIISLGIVILAIVCAWLWNAVPSMTLPMEVGEFSQLP
ncbi:MAG: hypothetical protein ACT4OO_03430 [Nitrospiraceae bacterium]